MSRLVTGISHITFSVSDLAASIAFYQQVFDAELLFRDEKTAYFDLAGLWLALNVQEDIPRSEVRQSYTYTAFRIDGGTWRKWSAACVGSVFHSCQAVPEVQPKACRCILEIPTAICSKSMRETARHALTPTTMKSYLLLKNEPLVSLPPGMPGPDVRYPASLVEHFLREFTSEGDVVFDPFAGFGTTFQAAEAMGRVGYGTEINPQRIDYARSQLQHPDRLIAADVRQLASLSLPPFHFSISSPPYMGKSDQENPLSDYSTPGRGYGQYLHDLAGVYEQVGHKMLEGGHIIIEVCNLRLSDGLTTLAWDIAGEVAKVLSFQGEVVVAWEGGYGFGYDHSYCLVFGK